MSRNSSKNIQQPLISTTRIQLQGYGLTRYQATKVTQGLIPISRHTKAHIYSVNDVIGSTRIILNNHRIKPQTTKQLTTLLNSLLEQLGNVSHFPITPYISSHSEVGDLARQLLKAMSVTDTNLVKLKGLAANINGKYQK